MPADIEYYLQGRNISAPWWSTNYATVEENATLDEIKQRLGWNEDLALCRKEIILPDGRRIIAEDCSVVRLSDGKVLGPTVSRDYKIHQPGRTIEFFRDLSDAMKCQFRRAGGLKGGSIIWALFQLDQDFQAPNGEKLLSYACVRTSFDRSTSTRISDTSIDVQCANTDALYMSESKKRKNAVDLRHSTELTDEVLKQAREATGIIQKSFSLYSELMHSALDCRLPKIAPTVYAAYLADRKDTNSPVRLEVRSRMDRTGHNEATCLYDLIVDTDGRSKANMVYASDVQPWESPSELSRVGNDLLERILRGPGAELRTDTAWALHSGVTDYIDHVAGRQADTALQSAWFGQGSEMKQESQSLISGLIAAAR